MPSNTLPIDEALEIVRHHVTDKTALQAIAKEMLAVQKEIADEKAAEKDSSTPKLKNRFVVLIRADDSNAAQLKKLVEGGAYVVNVPDDTTTDTYSGEALLARIKKAVQKQNDSLKRNRANRLIKTFTNAMNWLRPKAFKDTESAIKIKTKLPVEVIVVDKAEI